MDLAQRLSKLSPEQRKLFELKLKPQGIDIDVSQVLLSEASKQIKFQDLSPYMRKKEKSLSHLSHPIEPTEEKEYYPLSASQKRMYILNLFIEYNMRLAYQVNGNLDKNRIREVFQKLVQRHESLRTSFELTAEEREPIQKIHDQAIFEIEYYDLTNNGIDIEIKSIISQCFRGFDLSSPPLLRVGLVKLSSNRHLFLVNIHHIISDGVSMGILAREFARLYRGEELAELKIQYRDFSTWQNQLFNTEEYKKKQDYWLDIFCGELPILDMPTDYPRPPVQNFAGGRVHFAIEGETFHALKTLALKQDASMYMVLLAIYYTLLFRYTGQEDIIIGTITAGRERWETEALIGVFINAIAMINYPEKSKTFAGFLRELRQDTLTAFENQSYPFGDLLEKVVKQKDLSRNPLFDVMLIFQSVDMRSRRELAGLQVDLDRYEYESQHHAQQDMTIWAAVQGERIRMDMEYCAALFKPDTMERFARHFITLLTGAAANPKQKLSEIEIISEKEKRQILKQFNDTETVFPAGQTIHQLFERQAEQTPDNIAVVGPLDIKYRTYMTYISYRELNKHANQLAHLLRKKGVTPDTIVGIMMERSVEMIVGVIGILKAGSAYFPIDYGYPEARIKFMLADSNIKLLVTTRHFHQNAAGEKIYLPLDKGDACNASLHKQFPELSPTSLSYVIYTSGSTGRPKGVMVQHNNFVNAAFSWQKEYRLKEIEVNLLQMASFSFDVFAGDFVRALLNRGKLIICPEDIRVDPPSLYSLIRKQRITLFESTPSLVIPFMEYVYENKLPLDNMQLLIIGSESCRAADFQNLVSRFGSQMRIINSYGVTEAAIDTSYYEKSIEYIPPVGIVPIGIPMPNMKFFVWDYRQKLQPIGIPGELSIGGAGVARGYINNPEQTAEKFDHDLWDYRDYSDNYHRSYKCYRSYIPNKIYKTGDLARWLPDGNIEFLGRLDQQVKVRGYRIEPGEIENQLNQHENIEKTAAILKAGAICAYFTAHKNKEITGQQLRDFLSKKLPNYMIPAYFVQLQQIPLTPSGKINRHDLPEPREHMISTAIQYAAPRNDIERQIIKTWAEVLHTTIDKIGIYDHFFEQGGDSITANQVIARMRENYHLELSIRKFFESPTPAALAAEVGKEKKSETAGIPRVARNERIPLSFAQERLWFLHQLDEDIVSYHVPRTVRIRGKLDVSLLEHTFNEIIRRHEILRTVFPTLDGQPIQQIQEPFEIKIPVINLTGISTDNQPAKIEELTLAEAQERFDFEKGPLIRLTLLKLKEEEHLLMSTEHHFIHDGWTQGVLLKEFIAIYSAFSQGKPSPLPELPIQYADFTTWQRNRMQGEILDMHLAYWQEKLAGLPPVLELPIDRPRPHVISGKGAAPYFYLSEQLSNSLKAFSKQNGVTLFITMLTVFKVLLYRCTGKEDLCVGAGIANRRYKEIETLIGMIINTLPLRTRLAGNLTFNLCLQQVRTTCIEAYEHEDTPFEKIVEVLQPERTLSYTPLFQVLFSFMDTPTEYLSLPGLEVNAEPTHNHSAKFDLNIVVLPSPEEMVEEIGSQIYIEWEYNTDIFDQSTMEQMIHHYLRLLELAPQHPEKPIYSLPMLAEAEIHQLVYEWNHTAAQYPKDKTIHELLTEQVEQTPDHIAVVGAHELHQKVTRGLAPLYITYKELNQQANQLAYLLIEKGVHPDTITGIMIERSIGMIVGMLAILKAGGAYMPIDPDYPQERIRYMISDSRVNMLLTTPHLSCKWEKLSIVNCQLLIVNQKHPAGPGLNNPVQEPNSINNDRLTINHSQLKPATLAYVLYTSGTTGRPKGVMIEHINVVNLLTWYGKTYNLGKDSGVLQLTNYTFDPSVEDIFGTLLYGAVLYIGSTELATNGELFGKYVEKHQVNLVDFVPTLLNELLGSRQQPRTLETVISGGETLTDTVKQKIIEKGYRLYNHYGPTETTVDAMAEKCSTESVTIGYPISNVTCYILDNHQHPLPLCVIGELYISGAGLGRGYMNNPGLTAQKFIKNPFSPGKRMFRTGDLARRLPTGKIQFLGRVDQQVKIRGHRIELKEIENCLLKHPHIKKTIVIDNKNEKGETHLYAYVVPGIKGSRLELREYLSKYLPAYMIPAYFVQIEKLPLTSNGKIDRKSLPLPPLKNEKNYTAPVDEAEEKLAAIWSEVLGIEKDIISTTANFFELGGHSLNAAIVISKIRKEINVDVPLVELFKQPTIKSLAEYTKIAEKRIFTAQDDHLVLLKHAGSKNNNLFLVHDVTGEVDIYMEFSNLLKIDFNCWGILADRFDNYGPHNLSINETAKTYIKKIKRIQIHGPYYLAGWSIGGTIAFEILRQLEKVNEAVLFFALIDSMPPQENLPQELVEFSVQSELERVPEFLESDEIRKKAGKIENLEEFWHFVVNYLEDMNHYTEVENMRKLVPENIQQRMPNFNQLTLRQLIYYFNVSRTFSRACDHYIPGGKVKTPVHFFTARRSKIENKNDWQKYSHNPLKFHEIDGNHFSIFKMPEVVSFTKLFDKVLQNR